jgi:hypothetical protein
MRWLTACLVAAGVSVFGLTAQEKLERRPSRPNILFLFADDMRADTIGAHGNRHIRTPTLDRLARRGVSFRRAYGLGGDSGAVCVASRAMLMTGRSLFRFDTATLDGAPFARAGVGLRSPSADAEERAGREDARVRGGEGPDEAVQAHQHGAPEMECEASRQ